MLFLMTNRGRVRWECLRILSRKCRLVIDVGLIGVKYGISKEIRLDNLVININKQQ